MCYEVLREETVAEHSVPDLLRLEGRAAVGNGLEAAALLAVVLLWHGTPARLVALTAAAAVPLGALLHQVVLVVGALLLRVRARRSPPTPASG